MNQSPKDHLGRPIVVVTGIGVVTSLGEGKQDNWTNLTAGVSGIRKISRFSTDELRTQIAGTVHWEGEGRYCAPAHSLALARKSATEAVEQSRLGSRGSFPGPLFVAVSPAETNWDQRMNIYQQQAGAHLTGYDRLIKNVTAGDFRHYYSLYQFGSIAEHLADEFGTSGQPISLTTACASGATSVQLGVEAIRRGDTDAALCIGTDGEICEEMVSVLTCCLHFPLKTMIRRVPQSHFQNPVMVLSWQRDQPHWCWNHMKLLKPVARTFWAWCVAQVSVPIPSTEPDPSPMVPQSLIRLHARWPTPVCLRMKSTVSTRMEPAHLRMTRWNTWHCPKRLTVDWTAPLSVPINP